VKLSEFLSPDATVIPLAGDDAVSLAGALADRLIAAGGVVSPELLRERVAEPRPGDSVTLGDSGLLLHYRTEAVRKLTVAVGVTPGKVVILAIIPPREAGLYVQLLAAFARLLSRPETVKRMLAAGSAGEFLSIPDLAEYEVPEQLTVRELMTDRPRVTTPDTPLVEAALQLVRSGVGALPVVDEERRVVGMLGERELLRQLVRTLGGRDVRNGLAPERGVNTVRDVMTRQVMCVSPEQSVSEVAALMINKDVDRVPVARSGELVGFLTRGDIVRKLIGS
jgi:CBS domain-containing protein